MKTETKPQVFGRLTVTGKTRYLRNQIQWRCLCSCGTRKWISKHNILRGLTRSCGCLHKERASKRSLIDLTGKRFERLVVLDTRKRIGSNVYWFCRCDCGIEKWVDGRHLRHCKTKSCGCIAQENRGKANRIDLTERRFGRLTVLGKSKSVKSQIRWLCRCDCGESTWVATSLLMAGNTKSCGCLQRSQAARSAAARKKHAVYLTSQQRMKIEQVVSSTPKDSAEWIRSKMILLADTSKLGSALMDTEIAERLAVSPATVFYVRQGFANPDFRKGQNLTARERWLSDSRFRISKLISHRIREALRKQSLKKAKRAASYLGCSLDEFISHIESKFEKGMTWKNYGFDGWHLDHLRPCASFDLTKPEEVHACFHYTNYQPLWASKNVKKGSRWNGKHWRHSAHKTSGARANIPDSINGVNPLLGETDGRRCPMVE